MALQVGFYGGAGAVTGANFLYTDGTTKLLVDCGMEQGKDFCETCNYAAFPYDPRQIDALFVTHAHMDHIGRIPQLVAHGFANPIYMTEPTRDLMAVMLDDSLRILAREAQAQGVEPLYGREELLRALSLVKTLDYHEEVGVGAFRITLQDAGHILGSAMVRIVHGEGTTVFTGDLGNSPNPYLADTESPEGADFIVMESVYGDSLHTPHDRRTDELREILKEALSRGGTVLIPAFSMERTQHMLYELSNMFEAGELPQVPVYLDSPLAIKVTEVYRRHARFFKESARAENKAEGDIFDFPFLTKTPDRLDSEAIGKEDGPKIIIAGAGMSHAGRIQHHEVRYLPDPKTTLIMVGYQAAGSLGRRLMEREKRVKIGDQWVTVRAKVVKVSGYSAHRDRDGLLEFLGKAASSVKTAFIALGEPATASHFAQRARDTLGVNTIVPEKGKVYDLNK